MKPGVLPVTTISGAGTMVTGCRKLCLQGAFNTSEEPPHAFPHPLKHETEPLSLFGQGVRTGGHQSGPIIMCLWSANYLRQRRGGFGKTQLHYKGAGLLVRATVTPRRRQQPPTPPPPQRTSCTRSEDVDKGLGPAHGSRQTAVHRKRRGSIPGRREII